MSSFVTRSERYLLSIHNTISSKVKSFKRLFIQKGLLLRTFDYITWLYEKEDFNGIELVIMQLHSQVPVHWSPRYYKYYELIDYCVFLISYNRNLTAIEGLTAATDLIATLNLGHELGRRIEKKVLDILRN